MSDNVLLFLLLLIFLSLIFITMLLLGSTDDFEVCVRVSNLFFICE